MKKQDINVLCVEDEDEGNVTLLCAFKDGERPNKEALTEHINEFLGEYQSDEDEELYKHVVDTLHNGGSVELFGFDFYFLRIPQYENE